MKHAFIPAAMAATLMVSQPAQANAIQILDEHTTECIQQALDAVDMPRARLEHGSYGQTQKTTVIADDISATLTIDTSQFAPPRHGSNQAQRMASFVADIKHEQERDFDYQHRRSISITFNDNNLITWVNEGAPTSYWETADYEYVSEANSTPVLIDQDIEAAHNWVENASETAALIFTFCLTNYEQEYKPSDGENVRPPEFITIAAME